MSVPTTGLRIVTFNVLSLAYQLVARWAEQMGHEIVLVVTTPGPRTRPMPMFKDVVTLASANRHDMLVTTRLRKIAVPLIAALEPDIVLSATFPYRIPPEITSIPRYGALNLHPTPLPKYRGPNPMRAFYEGAPTMGATLHRTEADFDTGPILSKKEAPMPDAITREAIFATWPGLWFAALAEGVVRAVAGEPGEPQDHGEATYGGEFTEAEQWLNWQEPMRVLQRQTTALNLASAPVAKAQIDGKPYSVRNVEPASDAESDAAPGTVVEATDEGFLIAVADGVVRVTAAPTG